MKRTINEIKAWIGICLIAVIVFTTVFSAMKPAEKVKAEGDVVVKLHYFRSDSNYEGWDVWFWEYGKDGKAIPFENAGDEKVASFVLTPGTTQVGFIVRTADWTKDVDKDQTASRTASPKVAVCR